MWISDSHLQNIEMLHRGWNLICLKNLIEFIIGVSILKRLLPNIAVQTPNRNGKQHRDSPSY